MKPILLPILSSLAFVSCSNIDMNSQLSDENDPLRSPLSSVKSKDNRNPDQISENATTQNYSPGSWVETAMPDAGFYKKYPRFGGKPTRTLPVSTGAKIISYRGSHAKVELDSGEVGYIPSIMLIEKPEDTSYNDTSSYSPSKKSSYIPDSEPAPPSEDDILEKIRARQAAKESAGPTINTPSAPSSPDFVAPEPEVPGIGEPTKVSPPSVPSVPGSIPQIPAGEPATPTISAPAAPKVETPKSIPPTPPLPEIKINKPVDTTAPSPITAPTGDVINQDAALELRITEPFKR